MQPQHEIDKILAKRLEEIKKQREELNAQAEKAAKDADTSLSMNLHQLCEIPLRRKPLDPNLVRTATVAAQRATWLPFFNICLPLTILVELKSIIAEYSDYRREMLHFHIPRSTWSTSKEFEKIKNEYKKFDSEELTALSKLQG